MIEIICSECGKPLNLDNTNQMLSSITVYVDPCDCIEIDCDEYKHEIDYLEDKIDHLQYIIDEISKVCNVFSEIPTKAELKILDIINGND